MLTLGSCSGSISKAAISLSAWEWLWKGDEDVATPLWWEAGSKRGIRTGLLSPEPYPCSRDLARRSRDAESDRKSGVWPPVDSITAG
jgi:hypothetical protein